MAADPSADPDAARSDRLVALAIAALVVATVIVGALAPPAGPKAAHPKAADPAQDPACAEWSDGCRVCQRVEGEVACSMPGIACTLGEAQCQRRSGSP